MLGDGAGDRQLAAAAEIEPQRVKAQLPAFRVIGGVQFPALDRDAAIGRSSLRSRPLPIAISSARRPRRVQLARSIRVRNVPDSAASICRSGASSGGDQQGAGMSAGRTPSNDRSRSRRRLCGGIAKGAVQLRAAGAELHGQRQIAVDAVGAALDRDIDRLGAPSPPGARVVDQHRRAADRDARGSADAGVACGRRQQAIERDGSGAVGILARRAVARLAAGARSIDTAPPASRRRCSTGCSTVSEVGPNRPCSSGPSATLIEVSGRLASCAPSGAASRTLSARRSSWCAAKLIPKPQTRQRHADARSRRGRARPRHRAARKSSSHRALRQPPRRDQSRTSISAATMAPPQRSRRCALRAEMPGRFATQAPQARPAAAPRGPAAVTSTTRRSGRRARAGGRNVSTAIVGFVW